MTHAKTAGLALLAVAAVGLMVFSLKQSFFNEPERAGAREAAIMKASMEAAIRAAKEREARGERTEGTSAAASAKKDANTPGKAPAPAR
ncbi:MAG: hypothetical protein ACK47B_16505 [Armatimonadota bacterium]